MPLMGKGVVAYAPRMYGSPVLPHSKRLESASNHSGRRVALDGRLSPVRPAVLVGCVPILRGSILACTAVAVRITCWGTILHWWLVAGRRRGAVLCWGRVLWGVVVVGQGGRGFISRLDHHYGSRLCELPPLIPLPELPAR